MIEATTHRRGSGGTVIGVLAALYAVTFLIGALLHTGVSIPLGFTVISEPVIVPATIVETLCGIFLAVGAYAVFAHKTWAWSVVTSAHGFALGGVLLGITALAIGAGPGTESNTIYHRVMLLALVAGIVLLLTSIGRTALGRRPFGRG